jgi:hypothetical protein
LHLELFAASSIFRLIPGFTRENLFDKILDNSPFFFKNQTGAEGETSMLQKPRMPQIQGVKGEAVLRYAEPLRTQEMRHHTAFPKGKNRAIFLKNRNSPWVNIHGIMILFISSLPYWE